MSVIALRPDFIPANHASFMIGSEVPWRSYEADWWHPKAVLAFDPLNDRYMRYGAEISQTAQISTIRSSSHLLAKPGGALQSFGANMLASIKGLGAYIGGQVTNLSPYSRIFSTGWTALRSAIAVNSWTGPDGQADGAFLREDNTPSITHFMYPGSGLSVAPNTRYCRSCFVKAVSRDKGRIGFAIGGNIRGFFADFDLSAGAILSTGTESGGGIVNMAGVVPYANDVYRVFVSGIVDASSNLAYPQMRLADASGNISYSGDNTSGYYIWGDQTEPGLYPSPYIETSGGSATRLASAVSAIASGAEPFAGWSNASLASGMTELASVAFARTGEGVNRTIFEYSDGTVANYIRAYIGTTDKVTLKIVTGGVVQTTTALTGSITAGNKAYGFGWSGAGGYVTDGAETQGFGAIALPNVTIKKIGCSVEGLYLNDVIRQLQACKVMQQGEARNWAASA